MVNATDRNNDWWEPSESVELHPVATPISNHALRPYHQQVSTWGHEDVLEENDAIIYGKSNSKIRLWKGFDSYATSTDPGCECQWTHIQQVPLWPLWPLAAAASVTSMMTVFRRWLLALSRELQGFALHVVGISLRRFTERKASPKSPKAIAPDLDAIGDGTSDMYCCRLKPANSTNGL